MRKVLRNGIASLTVLFGTSVGAMACTQTTGGVEGGSNGNDRTMGGEEGELLLTGAMTISADGHYALMQRNDTSVLVDFQSKSAKQLTGQVTRFIFAKDGPLAYATMKDRKLVAIDLTSGAATWSLTPAYKSASGALLAKLSEDGRSLVIADADRILVIDTQKGDVRDAVSLADKPSNITMVPGQNRVLIAGTTRWLDHKPATTVFDVDLKSLKLTKTEAANCSAPLAIVPDASRAFMSPTFCEEGAATKPKEQWTNPDPVSVIDLAASGPTYLKNLPGFGPVAMDKEGKRIVAYLDMRRIDETMFADKSQIPAKNSAQYHIMTIDPKSLAFTLAPVGNVLPRFAMTPDGKALLVDATVQQLRGEVDLKVTVGIGGPQATLSAFDTSDEKPLGVFNLESHAFTSITGPKTALDRFVQLADNQTVLTLKLSEDGLGGDLFQLNTKASTSTDLRQSLRDVGLLADGKTAILRIRKPAIASFEASTRTISYFRAESYCLSLDGISCGATIEWRDSMAFQTKTGCSSVDADSCKCADSHDCY